MNIASALRRANRARVLLGAGTLVIALALATGTAVAGSSVNTGYFGGVAIMGYDPVAYFTDGQARKGSEEFAYDWLGTPWHFASDGHRELFIGDPAKYAPQYGGHCTLGVANGESTINIDPEAWRIIDGKLYLNYADDPLLDAPERAVYLAKADANWPAIKARLEHDSIN